MIDIPIDQMLVTVQKKLQEKTPVSIVRIGDGEAMVLNKFRDQVSLRMVLKRQFGDYGTKMPLDEIDLLHETLVQAYAGADIIGIPVHNRFMEDKESYWYKAFPLLIEHVGIDVIQTKLLTSIDFHIHWLENNCFEQLLTNAEHLVYISCRDLNQQFKSRFNIKHVWHYKIAPEMKFTSGYQGLKHFPDQFNKIERWVTKVPVQNAICLVGAGVAGKIYCNWMRDLGGYAIDIGSVMDSWSGKATRGAGRGLDAIDKTYAL